MDPPSQPLALLGQPTPHPPPLGLPMQQPLKRLRLQPPPDCGALVSSGASGLALPLPLPASPLSPVTPVLATTVPHSGLVPMGDLFGAAASPADAAAVALAGEAGAGAAPFSLPAAPAPRAWDTAAVTSGSSLPVPPAAAAPPPSSPRASRGAGRPSSGRRRPAAAAKPVPVASAVVGTGASTAAAGGSTPATKVERLLQRFPQTFCDELGIDIGSGSAQALWQWLSVALLFSARIKSGAAIPASQALFSQGLTTPQAVCKAGRARVAQLLAGAGYEGCEDKAAGFLVEAAAEVQQRYGGDLRRLRDAAGGSASQIRALLKRLRGTGDGTADIFAREAQRPWGQLFPAADKRALRAARLVGLPGHPQALAELCGVDPAKYARLVSALVRADMAKDYSSY